MADDHKEGDILTNGDTGEQVILQQTDHGLDWVPHTNVATDVVKSAGSGAVKGAADLAGMPGDVQNLATAGLNKVMPQPENGGQQQPTPPGWYGNVINALNSARGALELPTSAGVQKQAEKVTGPLYEPQTNYGKIASGAAQAVPFGMTGGEALLPNMVRAALAGGTSEAPGEATQGTPFELPARVGSGMLAYGASGAAFRPQINPTNATQAAAQRLENSGVPIRASDISGSRLQRTLEGGVPPPDRPQAVSDLMQQQGGIPIPPGNTQQYGDLVSQRYNNDLKPQIQQLEATTSIPVTPPLRKNLRDAVFNQTGIRAKSPAENQQVVDAIKEFNDKTQSGTLSGPQYNDLRQRWGSSGIPNLQTMAGHLDDAMDAAHPGVWPQLREDQANYAGLKAHSDKLGGAAVNAPVDPKTITDTMYKKTPMYRTAEDAQTVNAAQPKPYDFHTTKNVADMVGAL